MYTIAKFRMEPIPYQLVVMPFKARILTVKFRLGCPFIWAVVDTIQHISQRRIHLIAPGQEYPAQVYLKHLATCCEGPDEFHFFEEWVGVGRLEDFSAME